jgi:DNA 3'-phosphatase
MDDLIPISVDSPRENKSINIKINIKPPEAKVNKWYTIKTPFIPPTGRQRVSRGGEDSVLAYIPDLTKIPNNGKIFATDLFGTLIQAKNGGSVPHGLNDWVWCSDGTPEYLNNANAQGYTVVIFSNLMRMNETSFSVFKQRHESMISALNFEPLLFASFKNDMNHKPEVGMWNLFLERGFKVDKKQSFYTGDRYDLGDQNRKATVAQGADIAFAQRIGLPFFKPYEVYPHQPPFIVGSQRLIIMVGNQGSGKSTVAEQLNKLGFSIIKRDNKNYETLIINTLKSGGKVVFDATNPSAADRAPLIKIAKDNNIDAVVLWTSRNGRDANALRPKPVPEEAYKRYEKYFEQPLESEGLKVIRLN